MDPEIYLQQYDDHTPQMRMISPFNSNFDSMERRSNAAMSDSYACVNEKILILKDENHVFDG